jgi:phosphoribosyl 1,2-cyclic phosphodiesterase
MDLHILGSSSAGNGYILQNETEALVIEAGVSVKLVKQAVNFNVRKIVGCLISHEHGDHAQFAKVYSESGIKLISSLGTADKLKESGVEARKISIVESKSQYKFGNFIVMPFDVVHDCAQPFGFLIQHRETGTVLFLTDSVYSPYTFSGLNNIIVEANYSLDLIKEKAGDGMLPLFLKDRVIKSHLSIDNCVDLLKANDLTAVNNIVLIHLSNGNSNANEFRERVATETGKTVTIAEPKKIINFNSKPF